MKARLAIGTTILAALLLAACTPSGGPPTEVPPSGPSAYPVGGIAMAGPVCPVEQIPPNPSCAPRPVVGAVMIVTAADGNIAARSTTGSDGRWSAVLPPGDYTLTPQPVAGLLGVAQPVQFTVSAAGSSVSLDVTYDTGIR
jgi:hypothetical protein